MKLTSDSLKWPQIDAAFHRLYDKGLDYKIKDSARHISAIFEFGTGRGNSTKKICDYLTANAMDDVYVFTFDGFAGLPNEAKDVELFPKYTPGAYALNEDDPVGYIYKKVNYKNLVVTKCNFDCIGKYIDPFLVGKTLMVHIDCDLYQSTRDALYWLFSEHLIDKGTLLAYDEFQSTDSPETGGESLAHKCELNYWGCEAEEVWHNIYNDKPTGQEIRQSLFEVISV